MRASVRSNEGGRVDSPAVRGILDAEIKERNAVKCSQKWGGRNDGMEWGWDLITRKMKTSKSEFQITLHVGLVANFYRDTHGFKRLKRKG